MERKVALVTGASQGLGKGIALVLGRSGYDVALHCSSGRENAEATARMIEESGGRCAVLQADLSTYEGVVDLFAQFEAAFDRIDLLVNNAGITVGGSLFDMDLETFDKANGIDWRGGFFCTKFAAKLMVERGIRGNIILITSNQSTVTFGGGGVYGGAKAALRKFTRHAALELSSFGIRVNAIAPGFVDTGNPRMGEKEPTYDVIPMARWVAPEEIGEMILFMVSPAAASLTGVEIIVDGGAHLVTGSRGLEYTRSHARERGEKYQAAYRARKAEEGK